MKLTKRGTKIGEFDSYLANNAYRAKKTKVQYGVELFGIEETQNSIMSLARYK